MSAAFAQSDFPKFTAQTLVEAHHTAVIDEPVDPMHAKHVEMMSSVSRRREIALLVYRVVPSLVLIESTRVLHDEHAETTAAVTDFAIAVITDVASCPFTTDDLEKPESVVEKLVDNIVVQKGAPSVELDPAAQTVHERAPSFEYVPAAHSTHAEPEKYVPAVQDFTEATDTVEARGQFEIGNGMSSPVHVFHSDEG